MRRAGGWIAFAILVALSAIPAVNAARRTQGYDARAYIGAAYNLEKGRPIYTDAGFKLRLRDETGQTREVYFPPFLYHPALAWAYRGAMVATRNDWGRVTQGTNALGFILLSAGLIALLFACGAPPAWVGAAQAAVWWSNLLPFAFLFGNAGPIMSGLACLGGASILRRRMGPAGFFMSLACLFKPPIWLVWIALAALWRPDANKKGERARLLGGWLAWYGAMTLALVAGPGLGAMADYATMLGRTLGRAWCMSYMDASLGATVLRAISRWSPEAHGMMIYGQGTVEASVGTWPHEDLTIMKGANAAGLFAFATLMVWRRRDLAERPAAVAALAVVAGFLFQPVNWAHNYGCLFLVVPAIAAMRPGDKQKWWAAALTLLMLWPAAPLLMQLGFLTTAPVTEPDGAAMLRWHLMRLLNSLPTIWLGAMAGMIFAAASRAAMPTHWKRIALAIISRDGQFLVARRRADQELGGLWEFPGGKIEEGESAGAAAARESLEELGCVAIPQQELGCVRHAYEKFGVELHAVACELPADGLPLPLAADELAWMALDELERQPIPEANRELIALIRRSASE